MIPFKYILITRTNFGYLFHPDRFAYRKVKDATELGASIKLRKKEILKVGGVFSKFNM